MKKIINWFLGLLPKKAVVAASPAASVPTVVVPFPVSTMAKPEAPKLTVVVKMKAVRDAIRHATSNEIKPHPSNPRKVIVDGQVWKLAHKVDAKTGKAAYRRPHHPRGPVRFISTPSAAFAAAA